MQKFKQHYMIKLKEGEIHPLFRLAYLPENFASFAETLVLLFEGFLILIFIANVGINFFSDSILNSANIYLINRVSTQLLSFFRVTNVPPYDVIALFIMIIIYLFSRRYFEFIKYNLHLMRNSTNIEGIKNTDTQKQSE